VSSRMAPIHATEAYVYCDALSKDEYRQMTEALEQDPYARNED